MKNVIQDIVVGAIRNTKPMSHAVILLLLDTVRTSILASYISSMVIERDIIGFALFIVIIGYCMILPFECLITYVNAVPVFKTKEEDFRNSVLLNVLGIVGLIFIGKIILGV